MPKHFPDILQMASLPEHPTGQGVTEEMCGGSVGSWDSRLRHRSAHDMANTRWSGQRNLRSNSAQEDAPGGGLNPSIQTQVARQGGSDFTGQGKEILSVAFAADQDLTRSPAEVPHFEQEHFTRPESQPRQQEQDRIVASPSATGLFVLELDDAVEPHDLGLQAGEIGLAL